MDNLATLDTRDRILELADLYETVAALDEPHRENTTGRATPGSRIPPGLSDILDADETHRALASLDDWAEFTTHVLIDEADLDHDPGTTPGRLRVTAARAAHFLDHDDVMLALAFDDDLHEHTKTLRRLARRNTRTIRTGRACDDPACTGHLTATTTPDEDAGTLPLACDRCGARTPHAVWSTWPHARTAWVTVEHAARLAGTTVAGIKMRASRGQWRRTGTGRDTRYRLDDVTGRANLAAVG